MEIITEDDYAGLLDDHPRSPNAAVLSFSSGGVSCIPHGFLSNWLEQEPEAGTFYIGRCSGFGIGSIAKYDAGLQSLCVGRFVSGGLRLRFLLNGQHESKTISTYMFSIARMGMTNAPPPQYADSIVRNDVWIGDEAMMLGGGIIENGCIIGARSLLPPNFRSEPYGIYAGSPARLIRFRFPEAVRAALLDLAWWEMPMSWIRDNNDMFLQDMTADEGRALEIIARLKESRRQHEAVHGKPAIFAAGDVPI
ncbi:acetyltransferase [Massilia sp. AB1]|uniref:acetyltransferase n=1 Tax=Massilia sp. AB1 TaxID=2823371 RepID=UPI001B81A19C|nr:acetyltransferase [Massilia sp. AB1]MBQ5940986.1 acetyltransferase [Massilia sp. AB1]